ncbi:SLC13 family permease [Thalassospiraceae bacterium LMO-SO8]|nr:SLC13 family permease [Alphaproteobacteria bacterium LMO-S08]WND76234.1 SLC13 family permease [Thalassospiraceae bacterium LMO-SO8]
MTFDQIAIIGLIAAALALFVWDRWRYDVVAFSVLLAAVILGLVPAREAFSGFGHPATITVAAILILSHTLARTGASEILARIIERSATGMARHIAVLSGLGALMSSVMNNVAALGLLMPPAIQTTLKTKYHAGAVLMPLSFATILGGLITLLGTPPNIIIAAFRGKVTGEPFAMFDFTPVGLLVAGIGVGFLAVSARFLIPKRRLLQDATRDHMGIDKFVTEATVVKDTDAVGMTRGELRMLATDCDVLIVNIIRRGRRMTRLPQGDGLKVGDKLLLESSSEGLDRLTTAMDLKVGTMKGSKSENMIDEDLDLVEAVVHPGSRMIGRELLSLRLHSRYDTDILAVSRQGRAFRGRMGNFKFRPGDLVLFYGPRDHMPDLMARMGCLTLQERVQFGEASHRHARMAIAIFAVAVALASFNILPITIALGLAAVAMVVLNILPMREIYDGIDWPVVVLIGALIPVGDAFDATGTTGLIAQGILDSPLPLNPLAVLTLLMVVTMALSAVLNNAATAVIMGPVAITLSQRLGVDPDPMLMGVAVAASCAFVTPIGHQNNALVMGPGGYAFGDYWRLGLPLQGVVLVVAVPAILLFWPF